MSHLGSSKHIFTRLYSPSNLTEIIKTVAKESVNSLFGMRYTLESGNVETHIISSPSIRIGNRLSTKTSRGVTSSFKTYEGYLTKPSFLPLYTKDITGIGHHLSNLSKFLLPDEKVVFQITFNKMIGYEWKEDLLKMYHSYLKGNDFPLYYSIGRTVQDKAIGVLDKLGNFHSARDPIAEAEDKILSTGYDFQLALGIKSVDHEMILDRVVNMLGDYDSYNSIKLSKVNHEDSILRVGSVTSSSRRKRNASTIKQVLSEKEMLTLLVGNVERIINIPILAKEINKSNPKFDIFNILPENPLSDNHGSPIDKKELLQEIAEALKIVKIIPIARLYNEIVTEGVRLITIQFDIPKDKNISHLQSKRKDIQAALGVQSLSIEQGDEPNTVKMILPNDKPTTINLGELIKLDSFHKFRNKEGNSLSFITGVDELSNPIYLSLSKLVHLLVAGTTGSGKSVFLNAMVVTLLATHAPEELQMIMIDPKMVELQHYDQFPHVRKVVTDMKHAERVLRQLIAEMDNRYEEFQRIGVKNIQLYNNSNKRSQLMPYLVCVIDEYADLKDTNKDVEEHIGRLGQKARASGIHMVIATQRPDTKVISGRIKAVIPNAISFNLNNNNDYRTVFGSGVGDITLLGRGDGIMKIEGHAKSLQRFQSCIISVDESKEGKVYKDLAEYYNNERENNVDIIEKNIEIKEESILIEKDEKTLQLENLKKIIAATKETRMAPLREKLGIRAETLTELMRKLVDEGWLIKHDSRSKGYELVASEEEMGKWE